MGKLENLHVFPTKRRGKGKRKFCAKIFLAWDSENAQTTPKQWSCSFSNPPIRNLEPEPPQEKRILCMDFRFSNQKAYEYRLGVSLSDWIDWLVAVVSTHPFFWNESKSNQNLFAFTVNVCKQSTTVFRSMRLRNVFSLSTHFQKNIAITRVFKFLQKLIQPIEGSNHDAISTGSTTQTPDLDILFRFWVVNFIQCMRLFTCRLRVFLEVLGSFPSDVASNEDEDYLKRRKAGFDYFTLCWLLRGSDLSCKENDIEFTWHCLEMDVPMVCG